MIQTFNKVLGEANDPNTVIATGTLTTGELVVGAGNKGVKTINFGANKLFHTNNEAKLVGLDYSAPNKYVCTDENGNLTLKDKPIILPIEIQYGIIADQLTGYEQTLTPITPFDKLAKWLLETGQNSVIEIQKPTVNTDYTLRLIFNNPLQVENDSNIRVILTLEAETESLSNNMSEKPILHREIYLRTGDASISAIILETSTIENDAPEFSRYRVTLNKIISVQSGIYSVLSLPITVPAVTKDSDDVCYILVSGCLILGE